ncbi:MAG: 4-hydroxythreonine-4-phosphate dehydrogenase PdxA [bacterium]
MSEEMSRKEAVIGITMGDAAGVGPEIIVKFFHQEIAPRHYRSLVIGDAGILQEVAGRLGIGHSLSFHSISSPREADFDRAGVNVLNLNNISLDEVKIGQAGSACGRASVEYVERAIALCLQDEIQAMVTAPISKEAIHLAGCQFAGHTEMLAHHTRTRDFAMMLAGRGLRVVLVTTHAAIAEVSAMISEERIYRIIRLTDEWLRKFYPAERKIAVCGLNPHAGESGLFGREEIEAISPAIARARAEGIPAEGPYPADTLFYQAQKGIFGAVVAMYHDQGLIPLKMLAFDVGVNITLGLPIIRTSVDHGTAYDIAWQGKANISSLSAAVEMAGYLARQRQEAKK